MYQCCTQAYPVHTITYIQCPHCQPVISCVPIIRTFINCCPTKICYPICHCRCSRIATISNSSQNINGDKYSRGNNNSNRCFCNCGCDCMRYINESSGNSKFINDGGVYNDGNSMWNMNQHQVLNNSYKEINSRNNTTSNVPPLTNYDNNYNNLYNTNPNWPRRKYKI